MACRVAHLPPHIGQVPQIVTYAHRYKRPPRQRKPQPPLPVRIVHATLPRPLKPTKRRRQGIMVIEPTVTASTGQRSHDVTPAPTIVRPVTPKQRRWNAMRARMGLEP